MRIIRKILNIILCLCGAFYLMKLVDEITLSTQKQQVFVLLYFIIILYILRIFYDRTIAKKISFKEKKMIFIISTTVCLLFIAIFKNNIFPREIKNNDVNIEALNSKNENSLGFETWITSINIDGKGVDLSSINLNNNWIYKNESNVIFTNALEKNMPLKLSLDAARYISITFVKHKWSGTVRVSNESYQEVIDLYSQDGSSAICNITISRANNYIYNLFMFVCSLIVFIMFISPLITYCYIQYKKEYK